MPEKELELIPNEKENGALLDITPIPKIALGYVPFAFFLMFLASLGSGGFGGYYIFIYSGMCLMILLPIYSVYLVFLTWQRYKNGTLTSHVVGIHLLSFIAPLFYLLLVFTFNGSPAWLKTESQSTQGFLHKALVNVHYKHKGSQWALFMSTLWLGNPSET